jgi:phosphatidylinositol alpha 1,6-mannosyltransferase
VSILIGANDLVKRRVAIPLLAARLEDAVRQLRETGADVLLVTAFLPGNPAARIYARRFSAWATALAGIARRQGAILVDTDLHPQLARRENWGEDLVHLSSRGHRFLAYRAGVALGVPLADELGALDEALHATERTSAGVWWRRHALPWVWRRLHGRTAGDGRSPKHDAYVRLGRERGVRETSDV